jgi:hypothetical protein
MIEGTCLTVTLWTCIQEAVILNLARISAILTVVLHGFPQFLQTYAKEIPSLAHVHLLLVIFSSFFSIIPLSYAK